MSNTSLLGSIFPGFDKTEVIREELMKRRNRSLDLQTIRKTEDNLVFVYGSLMNGFSNNYILRNAKFMGQARTYFEEYEMYIASGFPVLNHVGDEGGEFVYGEVYAVDAETFMRLDFLESNGTMYTRKKTRVKLIDQIIEVEAGKVYPIEECWTYFGEKDYWDNFANMKEVPLTIPKDSILTPGIKWSSDFVKRH